VDRSNFIPHHRVCGCFEASDDKGVVVRVREIEDADAPRLPVEGHWRGRWSPDGTVTFPNGTDRKDGKFDSIPYYSLPEDPKVKSWCSQQSMIRVKHPKKSLDFYCGALGMRLISVGDFPQWGFTVYFVGYVDEKQCGPMPKPDASVEEKFAYSMKVPGCIELTWNHGSETQAADRIYNTGNGDDVGTKDGKQVKGGFGHLGITVPDVYDACDRFQRMGCEFKKTPNAGGMKGLAFVKDPDGYSIEVLPYGKAFPFPTKPTDCAGVAVDGGEGYTGGLADKK